MIRAIAVAVERCDLVGTVDLECQPDGLLISFVRASGFQQSYAPVPAGRGAHALIPYQAVHGVWDDGQTLRLAINWPQFPYRNLALTHFTFDRRIEHRRLHRQRVGRQLLVALGAAALVGLSVGVVRHIPEVATSLASVITFGLVAGALLASQKWGRQILLGGAREANERRAFFYELRARVAPGKTQDWAPQPEPAKPVAVPPEPQAAPSKSAAPAPVGFWKEISPTLMAVGAAGLTGALVLVGAKVVLDDPGPPTTAENGPKAPLTALISAAAPAPEKTIAKAPERQELFEPCTCERATSPVFPKRIPMLQMLPKVTARGADDQAPTLRAELAAVNNTAENLKDLSGMVQFFHLRPAGPGKPPTRTKSTLRSVFYPGPLGPGKAIKWRVRGHGNVISARLDEYPDTPATRLASADQFAELLRANTRTVRLYGAQMLTHMRDPRAAGAIEELQESSTEAEAAYLEALARAAAPVFSCGIQLGLPHSGRAEVSACVMNTSGKASGPLKLRLQLYLGETPSPLSEGEGPRPVVDAEFRKGITVGPNRGIRVSGSANISKAVGKEPRAEVLLLRDRKSYASP